MSLDLRFFRTMNLKRANEAFGHARDPWNAAEWGCALAGEVGELCNLIKKERRGEAVPGFAIESEIADVFAYLDLVAAHYGVDLSRAVVAKWNEVSTRRGYSLRIDERGAFDVEGREYDHRGEV